MVTPMVKFPQPSYSINMSAPQTSPDSYLAAQTTARTRTATESRALELLGQNIHPSHVAAALGVTEALISQYLADPEFVSSVAELRFKNLAKHNQRDLAYDSMEDALISKLNDLLPFMMKPLEILRAIQVINGAKRRGSAAPESLIQKQEVISLTLPIQIVNQFTTNSANQVIKAGEQELVTVQSAQMSSLLTKHQSAPKLPPPGSVHHEPSSHSSGT